jgi:hypothetical protein
MTTQIALQTNSRVRQRDHQMEGAARNYNIRAHPAVSCHILEALHVSMITVPILFGILCGPELSLEFLLTIGLAMQPHA